MKNNDSITRQILKKIRESKETPNFEGLDIKTEKEMNFLEEADYLMSRTENKKLLKEEAVTDSSNGFVITKSTPQFGDIRSSQEETLLKTIGENIEFGDNALVFYKENKDLVLSARIRSLNLAFQFRYNDPSAEGIYIWANGLQLTETNARVIGKVRDAFVNWRQALIQNGDLLDKLAKVADRDE